MSVLVAVKKNSAVSESGESGPNGGEMVGSKSDDWIVAVLALLRLS